MPNDKISKIISLAFLAFILLNFPIIGLFGKEVFLFGFPILYLYIFIVWFALILTLALILRRRKKKTIQNREARRENRD